MLAWRILWRDWRSGELRVLALSIILAVTIVTSIGLFVERLHGGILDRSKDFLAADIALESSRALDSVWEEEGLWREKSSNLGLLDAQTLRFQSMVYAGDEMQLAAVKAASESYPLKGSLLISDQLQGAQYRVNSGPKRGEVWLDSRLLPLLAIKPFENSGDAVRIQVGDSLLRVTALVHREPDQASNVFGFGPRVLMHLDDIAATGIVQPGSQVTYRYLFAGDKEALKSYRQWLSPRLSANQKWLDIQNSQPTVSMTIARAEKFLLLGGSLGVLLAAVSAALAAFRYSEGHYNYAALMKSLGAGAAQIKRIYLLMLMSITALTTLVGWLLGWLLQLLFVVVISDMFGVELPLASNYPYLLGLVTGLVCVICFALPPIWSLQKIPPLRVLRRDIQGQKISLMASVMLGAVAITGLMLWYSKSAVLTFAVLGGVLFLGLILVLCAWLLLRGSRLVGMHAGSVLGLALANLRRRGWQNAIYIFIFALAIMLLLVLTMVRGTLINDWQRQLPAGTPNNFLVNISAHEVAAVDSWLDTHGLNSVGLYPMVRGRLMEINHQPVLSLMSKERLHKAGANREMNLTWSTDLPQDNVIEKGEWWQGPASVQGVPVAPVISLEKRLAENLGVGLGDTLGFKLGARELQARVVSIRSLEWQSMRPNFYVMFPAGVLDGFPATYMTSFYLPEKDKHLLHPFIRQFPTVTLLEIDAILGQIRQIIDQVGLAIELLLGLIVTAGGLVLVASVQNSIGERYHECAILRALGADRKRIMGSIIAEFAIMGLIAGLLAVVGAELSVYTLQTQVFQMQYNGPSNIAWLGPLIGLTLVTGIGYYSTRGVVSAPPLQVLRQVE